jgi:cyclin-dependent kinase regulatory subunit CKS1
MPRHNISYSDKYYDDVFEYRHVILPPELAQVIPKKLMSEQEWRSYGIQQSVGWVHYALHKPEPGVLLFRRPKTEDFPAGTGPENISQLQ